jgi:AAA+ ATPase superfamily predicted ATPase
VIALEKPRALHDRDAQWAALTNFMTSPAPGARLGLVYGRRRQGKTLLLGLLAQATGGLMFTALPVSRAQNLLRLAQAYQERAGGPLPAFDSWNAAIDALVTLGERRDEPTLVVLDEFQYLHDTSPELASVIQIALSPAGRAATSGHTRLVLCGSALSTMRGLLAGSAPLRGRATLEMMIHPFDYREAAAYWGLEGEPELAFRVDAVLGGTPAYLAMAGTTPSSVAEFDDWVARTVLNPDSALFREGAVLLHEQPGVTEATLYHSVLSAIVQGYCRRNEIAAALGRTENSLSYPLAVLEAAQLVERIGDAMRKRRPVYRVTEPMIRLHQLVIAPNEALLVARAGMRVWNAAADTVTAKIYGPHLEDLSRRWILLHAASTTLGGTANTVAPTTIACKEHKAGHEVDAVAVARIPFQPDRILAIAEAKATKKLIGHGELTRLEHLRELMGRQSDTADEGQVPKLLLFSRSGFTRELIDDVAERGDVELIDIQRLYYGC